MANRSYVRTILVASLLFFAGAGLSLFLSARIDPRFFNNDAFDVWFEADLPRIFSNMTSTDTYTRSDLHPLFELIVFPPTRIFTWLGFSPETAVRCTLAAICGAWTSFLFLTLRAIGCRGLDALIFTMVGLSSASALFFFAVPETFLVGSITMMIALIWAAWDEAGRRSIFVEVLVSAATLSVAVTNWMVGVLSTLYRRRTREALLITATALLAVVVLWSVQKSFFPNSPFFLTSTHDAERRDHMFCAEAVGLMHVAWSFFAHTVVMPAINITERTGSGAWPILLTQASSPFSSGLIGNIALIAWIGLFIAGVAALLLLPMKPRLRLLLGSALLGQLLLHLIFGNETFLYSPHWLPILIAIAALATLTKWRVPVIAAALVLCGAAAVSNMSQFGESIAFLRNYQPVLEERKRLEELARKGNAQRPPVGDAISIGGRRDYDQAAYDAAGGIWPAADAFLVSFWVVDAQGKSVQNPSLEVARLEQTRGDDLKVTASTRYYLAAWESPEPRIWYLTLRVPEMKGADLFMTLRGIGGDFGRIYDLRRTASNILVNGRWDISSTPAIENLEIGSEDSGAMKLCASCDHVTSKGGWAIARLGSLGSGSYKVSIVDRRRHGSVDTFLGVISHGPPTVFPEVSDK
jgi:hypothetical protein